MDPTAIPIFIWTRTTQQSMCGYKAIKPDAIDVVRAGVPSPPSQLSGGGANRLTVDVIRQMWLKVKWE